MADVSSQVTDLGKPALKADLPCFDNFGRYADCDNDTVTGAEWVGFSAFL
jgi:hypothetical protein